MDYDVCIIGGGINGVAIAEQTSKCGLKTILLEKTSLGAGASTKTSKLAHGGLRYLEQFNFGLVREALKERNNLLQIYPDCVKPLPFIYPVYDNEWDLKIRVGMKLYDILSYGSKMPRSKRLNTVQLASKLPWLKKSNIKTGYQFYDAVMDDYKVLHATANLARDNGTIICENEPVVSITQTENSVTVNTGERSITSKVAINATGAWSNDIVGEDLVRPSKGVHIVTDKIYTEFASVLKTPEDGRVFFTIPYYQKTVIGTTDTFYDGDLDNVVATDSDVDYILNAINSFSLQSITKDDIIYTYAGLRPLANTSRGLFASSLTIYTVYTHKCIILSLT